MTLYSRSSLLLPCDVSMRAFELLVLLDQHWSMPLHVQHVFSFQYAFCVLSRTGRLALFVRS